MESSAAPHLPSEWAEAIGPAAEKRRVVVLGATDMGKSTFIRACLAEAPEQMRLIDLDPGQKMLGPPGTASLGCLTEERLERFIFLGSTSASNIGGIAQAGTVLAAAAERRGKFIVNTSGFVRGIGARLQAITLAAIRPDLIVEIGADPAAAPIAAWEGAQLIRVPRSPAARRKTDAARAAIRQAAFERSLQCAELLRFDAPVFDPAPPSPSAAPAPEARPVCALSNADGQDLSIGVIERQEGDSFLVHAAPPGAPVPLVRLGKMWAVPQALGWRLLDKLAPSWAA